MAGPVYYLYHTWMLRCIANKPFWLHWSQVPLSVDFALSLQNWYNHQNCNMGLVFKFFIGNGNCMGFGQSIRPLRRDIAVLTFWAPAPQVKRVLSRVHLQKFCKEEISKVRAYTKVESYIQPNQPPSILDLIHVLIVYGIWNAFHWLGIYGMLRKDRNTFRNKTFQKLFIFLELLQSTTNFWFYVAYFVILTLVKSINIFLQFRKNQIKVRKRRIASSSLVCIQ